MNIHGIDHYTLRVDPSALAQIRAFYCDVLGLYEGDRPAFSFPGHWLYAIEHRPIVHLAGNAAAANVTASGPAGNGRLDHISLRSTGLLETRERLLRFGVAWLEAPVPGAPLHQVFLHDPTGLKIELTFDAEELTAAGARDAHDAS